MTVAPLWVLRFPRTKTGYPVCRGPSGIRRRDEIVRNCRGPLLDFSSSSEYDRTELVNRLSATHASPGFRSLQRLRMREATFPGFAWPGYVAPSRFLTPLTPCSSRILFGPVSDR
jgi:hypothetical protein